jgi:hypothetical protein
VPSLISADERPDQQDSVTHADLLIGAVLILGAKAPRLVTREMLRKMEPADAPYLQTPDQCAWFACCVEQGSANLAPLRPLAPQR